MPADGNTSPLSPESEVAQLRQLLQAQSDELAQLRAQLEEAPERLTRRGLVKGLGIGSLVALGAAGVALGGAGTAAAAPGAVGENSDLAGELPAFLTLTGTQSGVIKGEVTQRGHEGKIECLYFSGGVISPRDAASGLPTGKRQHKPLTIRKHIDKSTPLIAKALVNNEEVSGKIEFFKKGPGQSSSVPFYTIEFKEARVTVVDQNLPETMKSAGEQTIQPYEEVQFVYQKIIWTIVDGGIMAEDDWTRTA